MAIFIVMMWLSLIALVLFVCCFGRMRMFQKAGVAAWKAWVPFYRDYVLCEITMGKGWYFVFGLVPFLVPVMNIVYAVEVTQSFGRKLSYGILYFFFPWLCELIIGCGSAQYLGSMDLEAQVKSILGTPKKQYRDVPGQNSSFQGYSENKQTAGENMHKPTDEQTRTGHTQENRQTAGMQTGNEQTGNEQTGNEQKS